MFDKHPYQLRLHPEFFARIFQHKRWLFAPVHLNMFLEDMTILLWKNPLGCVDPSIENSIGNLNCLRRHSQF